MPRWPVGTTEFSMLAFFAFNRFGSLIGANMERPALDPASGACMREGFEPQSQKVGGDIEEKSVSRSP